ncbi:MAG TPA: hypothetical protein DCP92_16600 [Nitrospiraceae bacterium]|jgi:hypothetical protein|nr:hypothetical protein [Nitrospiraceae bacterium]
MAGTFGKVAAGGGLGLAGLYGFNPKFRGNVNKLLFGRPEKFQQRPMFGPEQRPLYEQLQAATMGRGAGGAFGEAGDYYRSLLENDNETFNAMAQPELRRFRQEIIPEISEQFAGMGAGGLSSSGFRNAAVAAGTDLSERLAAMRAQLRGQGAQGLMSLGQYGLSPFYENIMRPAQPGLLQSFAGGAGKAAGAYLGGKFG